MNNFENPISSIDLRTVAPIMQEIVDFDIPFEDPEQKDIAFEYLTSIASKGVDSHDLIHRLSKITWLNKLNLNNLKLLADGEYAFSHNSVGEDHPDPVAWFTKLPSPWLEKLMVTAEESDLGSAICKLSEQVDTIDFCLDWLPSLTLMWQDPQIRQEIITGEVSEGINYENCLEKFDTLLYLQPDEVDKLLDELSELPFHINSIFDERLTPEGLAHYVPLDGEQRKQVWQVVQTFQHYGLEFGKHLSLDFSCTLALNEQYMNSLNNLIHYLERIHLPNEVPDIIPRVLHQYGLLLNRGRSDSGLTPIAISDYIDGNGVPTQEFLTFLLKKERQQPLANRDYAWTRDFLSDETIDKLDSESQIFWRFWQTHVLENDKLASFLTDANDPLNNLISNDGKPTSTLLSRLLTKHNDYYQAIELLLNQEVLSLFPEQEKPLWIFWQQIEENDFLKEFLVEHKDQLHEFIDEKSQPTRLMIESALKSELVDYDLISIWLTDEVFQSMSEEDRAFWMQWKSHKSLSAKYVMVQNRANLGKFLNNGHITNEFLCQIMTVEDHESELVKIKQSITDEALSLMDDEARNFWSRWCRMSEPKVLQTLWDEREQIASFVDEQGIPSEKLLTLLVTKDPPLYHEADELTYTNGVFEHMSRESKQFWKLFQRHNDNLARQIFIKHRDNLADYIDYSGYTDIPTQKMLEEMLEIESSSYEGISKLITVEFLSQLSEADKKFWSFWKNNRLLGQHFASDIKRDYLTCKKVLSEVDEDHQKSVFFNLIMNNNTYASPSSRAGVWTQHWTRDDWRHHFGDEGFHNFLHALPTQNNEARNAFTHNRYDRTSSFITFILEKCGADVTQIGGDQLRLVLENYIRAFGLAKTPVLFHYYANLMLAENNPAFVLPEDIAASGISSKAELLQTVNSLSQRVFANEPIMPDYLRKLSHFEKQLLSTITGKDKHRFDNGRASLDQIIDRFIREVDDGEIKPLESGYLPSTVSLHEKIITFDLEAIRQEYAQLREEIISGIDRPFDISDVAQNLNDYFEKRNQDLQQTIETIPQERRKYVEKEMQRTLELHRQIKSSPTVEGVLTHLIKNPFGKGDKQVYQAVVRKLLFKKLFQKHDSPQFVENLRNTFSQEVVDPQSLSAAVNVVDEMVKAHLLNLKNHNQEQYWDDATFSLLSDKKTRDTFDGLFLNAKKIRHEINNFKTSLADTSVQIGYIPDRGFIGEMSGYLADVCYTKECPLLSRWSVTPYKFVTIEGGERKFIGSVLVFEVMDQENNLNLLIRAFDVPEETKYPISDMIETFADKMSETAKERGATRVIAAGTPGAISNYQMTTHHVLSRYKKDENRVVLQEPFAFNGYDITNECYVLRQVGNK
jgi:hypothetical protein